MDLDRPQNGQDTISHNEQSQVIEHSEGQFSTEEIQSNNNVQSENPPDNPPQSNQNEMNKLMEALSDSENRYVTFYDEKQLEVESLKKELLNSKENSKKIQ